MAICWWIIFASWLYLPRYVDSDTDKHPAIMCSFAAPNLSHFLYLSITSTPKQCISYFLFWSSSVGWQLQNIPSQDIHSLQKATAGRILCPCDFPVECMGIFPVGICFPGVQIFMCYCYIVLHILIIQSFKAMYPSSACTASLIRCSSIDLNLFLIFLSCVLHNLWTFTEPHLHSFRSGYNLIIRGTFLK